MVCPCKHARFQGIKLNREPCRLPSIWLPLYVFSHTSLLFHLLLELHQFTSTYAQVCLNLYLQEKQLAYKIFVWKHKKIRHDKGDSKLLLYSQHKITTITKAVVNNGYINCHDSILIQNVHSP